MTRALLVVPLLLWAESMIGATKPESNVLVIGPLLRLVRPADLRSICGTTVQVEACTSFAGELLRARCEAAEDHWRLSAHAQFIPVMHLLGVRQVAHELQHITDIEHSVATHLDALQRRTFASPEACEDARAEAVAHFQRDMDAFKMASNAMRHPKK